MTRLSDNWNRLADIFNNEEPQRVAIAMVDCVTEVELCTGTLDACMIYGCMHDVNIVKICISCHFNIKFRAERPSFGIL